jgi:hypothetical protein
VTPLASPHDPGDGAGDTGYYHHLAVAVGHRHASSVPSQSAAGEQLLGTPHGMFLIKPGTNRGFCDS